MVLESYLNTKQQAQKPLTEKQRARITENFKAAKALLARKRPIQPLKVPDNAKCRKHTENVANSPRNLTSNSAECRSMDAMKVCTVFKFDEPPRTPLAHLHVNLSFSRNLHSCNTKFSATGECISAHNKSLDSEIIPIYRKNDQALSAPRSLNDTRRNMQLFDSECKSEPSKKPSQISMQNVVDFSTKTETGMDIFDEEFDDAFLEEIDALCNKRSSLSDQLLAFNVENMLDNTSVEDNDKTTRNPSMTTENVQTLLHDACEGSLDANFLADNMGCFEAANVTESSFEPYDVRDHVQEERQSLGSGTRISESPMPLCHNHGSNIENCKESGGLTSNNFCNGYQNSVTDSGEASSRCGTLEVLPEYLRSLNETQREAATSDITKPLLILAGPGSGKTSTMVARLLTVVKEGIQPKNILAMTFTTAAATEMRERVGAIVGKNVAKELNVCTFHSFCLQLCRSHAEKLGRTSEFLIYGHSQQRRAVIESVRLATMEGESDIIADSNGANVHLKVDKGIEPIRDKVKKWQNFVTQAKSAGRTPEDYEKMGNTIGASILKHYNGTLKACNALDYHDFITCAVSLLKDDQDVFAECQNLWAAILVDEFQDTSSMQYYLLKLLASHKRITVVGDDDQSIFSFNGADISGFESFRKDFPAHKEVRLHQNYRSTRCIVEAASSLIQNNIGRCSEKRVFTDNSAGDKIIIKECRNEEAQCSYIVDNILMNANESHSGERSFANIAILYRRQVTGRLFQSALRARKIPFNVHGVAFYRKKVIKVVISMLQTTLPQCADGPFRCVFKALFLGEKEEKKKAVEYIEKVASSKKSTFLMSAQEIFSAKVSGTFNRRQLAQGRRVLFVIDTIYKLVRKEHSLSAVVTSILNFIPQKHVLEKRAIVDEDGSKLLNEEDDPRTVLDYLLDDVTDFLVNQCHINDESENGTKNVNDEGCLFVLKNFLDYLSSREMENFKARREHNRNSVTLTTMHQSKGLEWDTVYIVKANDTETPLLHESRGSVAPGGTSLEEERRLFYVAMTRARKKLFILYVVMDSNRQWLQPSRFLAELPRTHLHIQTQSDEFQRLHTSSEGMEVAMLVKETVEPLFDNVKEVLMAESSNSRTIFESSESSLDVDNNEENLEKRAIDDTKLLSSAEKENSSKPSNAEFDSILTKESSTAGAIFLKQFDMEARSMIAALFHTWAKKRAFQDPKRLLDKVGFVIDERLRSKTSKNKNVLRSLKCCLKDQEALLYAEHVLKWEMLPADEKILLQAERQEHFQKQAAERAMDTAAPTSKQIGYLQQLGCTVNPTSRLHASKLIEQYKRL